ncbi:MAG: hypothetical protein AAF497_01700, partial [Planctomycetota bacterium]
MTNRKNATRFAMLAMLFLPTFLYGSNVIISVSNPSGLQGETFGFTAGAASFFDTEDYSLARVVYDQDTGNLSAFHIRENGNFLVSTNNGLNVDGQTFSSAEVIDVNPATGDAFSVVDFDNVLSSTSEIEVDAVSEYLDGRLAFSVRNDAVVSTGPNSGKSVSQNEILLYDFASQSVETLLSSDLITGGDRFNNVSGVSVMEDGKIGVSVSTGGVTDIFLGGVAFQRNDAVLFDPILGEATTLIEGANVFVGPPNPSINALHIVGVPEPAAF